MNNLSYYTNIAPAGTIHDVSREENCSCAAPAVKGSLLKPVSKTTTRTLAGEAAAHDTNGCKGAKSAKANLAQVRTRGLVEWPALVNLLVQ